MKSRILVLIGISLMLIVGSSEALVLPDSSNAPVISVTSDYDLGEIAIGPFKLVLSPEQVGEIARIRAGEGATLDAVLRESKEVSRALLKTEPELQKLVYAAYSPDRGYAKADLLEAIENNPEVNIKVALQAGTVEEIKAQLVDIKNSLVKMGYQVDRVVANINAEDRYSEEKANPTALITVNLLNHNEVDIGGKFQLGAADEATIERVQNLIAVGLKDYVLEITGMHRLRTIREP